MQSHSILSINAIDRMKENRKKISKVKRVRRKESEKRGTIHKKR